MYNIAVSTKVVKLSKTKTKTKMQHAKFKHLEVLVVINKQELMMSSPNQDFGPMAPGCMIAADNLL